MVEVVLAGVHAALDALGEVDARVLSQDELAAFTVAVHECQARLDAQVTRVVGVFDTHGDPKGAVTTSAWLAWKCRLRKSAATVEVANARALREMPEVEAAFGSGVITEEHVRVFGRALRFNRDAFVDAEHELVDAARELRFGKFCQRVKRWELEADPDRAEADAQARFERRRAFISQTFEDTWQLDAQLDPLGGGIVANEVRRLERQLFERDWADARARLGEAATSADLRRSAAQRRADALVIMAVRSAMASGDARRGRILLTVLFDHPTFQGCGLADGTVVTPEQVKRLVDDDELDVEPVAEPVRFDEQGRVINLGRRRRLFTGGARRAVEVRDLECTHESCDVPYERCDVDHHLPWAKGGATDHDNGRLRCPHHNPGRRRQPEPP